MKPAPILLVIAVTLAVALGVHRLDESEPHADVLVVQAVFAPSWTELTADFFDPEGFFGGVYPPLYFLTAKAVGRLFGQSLPALSAVSVISLALLVGISWFGLGVLVERPSTWHRFWFSLAVGTSPAHIWWAQTPKYMMFLYLVYATSLLLGFAFARRPTWPLTLLFAFSTGAVVYTQYVGVFFVAAQFACLALLVILRKDWRFGRWLAAAAIAVGIVLAPLLPTFIKAKELRDEEGYNVGYEQSVHLSALARGYFMEWNFGNSLLPERRGMANLQQLAADIAEGHPTEALTPLGRLTLPIFAAAILAASMAYVAHQAYRERGLRLPIAFLAMVGALALLFSFTVGLADRFGYLGYGTWCTLAVLAVGFSGSTSRVAAGLQVAILAVHALSLTAYYSNLDLKYPGTRLIAEFLRTHGGATREVVVDDWIWHVRSAPHNREALPDVHVTVVPSASDLDALEPRDGTFGFFAGLREDVEAELARASLRMAGWSWEHVVSWESMEKRERSIHAYRISSTASPEQHHAVERN